MRDMEIIDEFIAELNYYRIVIKTQTDPEILKAELADLIADSNDFAEALRPQLL